MKKSYWIIIACVLAVVLAAGGVGIWLCVDNEYIVDVNLNGQQDLTLEYGETYEEPGAEAVVYGTRIHKKPAPVEVTVTDTVDTDTLGTYEVKYTATCERGEKVVIRTVHVVDSKPPVIELVSDPDKFTFPNQPYEEEGFTAADNYDGDLTDQVEVREENGVVIYKVTDTSGNQAEVTREIHYDDPVEPEIVLSGSKDVFLTVGSGFEEPGYGATDNCDGDISDRVTVSGSVNTDAPGTYTLEYTVSDSYGNTASATRKVVVAEAKPQSPSLPENTTGKIVYLTFDDGPSAYTGKLLEVLAKYNVKATFFVVNTPYVEEIAKIAAQGHTVAVHTATHVFSQVYASDEAYYADLAKMQDIIESYTGQRPTLLRFPGGSSNTVSKKYSTGIMSRLTKSVVENGYHYFDWNVDSMDAGGAQSSDEVFHNVVKGISGQRHSVVLQHDTHKFSVDAVERIIVWGLENGYTFLPLTADSPGCHHGVGN